MNSVISQNSPAPSARARELHKSLFIADLHADSLLWGRNLLERSSRGHVDIPRLVEGNIALQAFTIVTKVPRGLNIERNDDSSDLITPQFILLLRPPRTWTSLTERALDQARRLSEFAVQSHGQFVVLRTSQGVATYRALRAGRTGEYTAGFLGIEGAQALDGNLDNLDRLYDAGVRMMAPTHFFDNDIAGSAHGVAKGGLTQKGREWVRRMDAKHMLIDLAHASPQTINDVLALTARPVVVSHTGVKGACNNTRNLSDDQLRAIARTGGVIGIGYWHTAVCGTDAQSIARSIRYAVNLVGIEHVALGSDFDGAVTAPFDTTGLVFITDALFAAGFSETEIRLIMGENLVRVLQQALP